MPQWTEDTNTSDILSGYQVFGMLPRHTYLPNEITCGDNGGSRDYDYLRAVDATRGFACEP